jgi:hypothetical protein
MGKFLKDDKNEPAKAAEPSVESRDKEDGAMAAPDKPGVLMGGERQLTNQEVAELADKFKAGMDKMKSHRWSGKKE